MGQRLIISEEDRNRIAGMHNLVNEQRSMEKPRDGQTLYNVMTMDYGMDKKVANDLAKGYEAIMDGEDVGAVYKSFEKRNSDVMVPAALILRLLA